MAMTLFRYFFILFMTSVVFADTPPPVNGFKLKYGNSTGVLITTTGTPSSLAGSSVNDVLTWNGTNWISSPAASSGVTSVTASSPLFSSGGTTPNITIQNATSLQSGALTFTDWNTFNNKQAALTPGSISTSTTGVSVGSGASSTVGPNVTVNVQTASGSQPGLLSSTDWTTFNNKQSALTFGNFTDAGTDGIIVTNGTGVVIGTGTSIAQQVADAAHNGYLSQTDWSTFNSKQAAGSYITALTGDVTASGPGSVAATVAKIQGTTITGTTGTGNVVFSASPTLTGTLTAATISASGNITGANLSGTNTGDVTLTAVGSSPNANAASLSGQALTIQPADSTNPGVVTSGTQTFGGAKTMAVSFTAPSFVVNGTGGNGFDALIAQSSNPSTPASGFKLFADNSGRLSWIGTNGFVRTFDGTSNTADRVYTLPNVAGGVLIDGNLTSSNVVAVNSSHTVQAGEMILLVDTSASRNITLPNPAQRRIIKIKDATGNSTANPMTLVRFSTEKIDTIQANRTLSGDWNTWTVVSDGTDWFML